MKLRSLIETAGLRRRPMNFGYLTRTVDIVDGGSLNVADWQHPHLLAGRDMYARLSEDTLLYQEIISPGDFCVDIGAHVGDTTLPMAVAAGPTGCVLALEPNPYVYHVLERNARANRRVTNIYTLMAAAGEKDGFLEFEYSDRGFCNGGRHEGMSALKHGHPYKQNVFCLNLQNELRENFAEELKRLRLIKVDAEGYDLYVLRSLSEIIDEMRPLIRAEVFRKTSQEYRKQMFELFDRWRYRVFKMRAEPFDQGEQLNIDSIILPGHFDILGIPA